MALVQRNTHERILAFSKILQAIREDDLWTAAWCMSKFLKTPHVLSPSERKLLQDDYSYRMNRVRDATNLLESLAFKHAKEDHDDWLEKGNPFPAVEEASFRKHGGNPIDRLLDEICTYSRSAGYLRAIINMKVRLPPLTSAEDGVEVFELEAMGPSPGVKNVENLDVSELDWEIIRHEEVCQGAYQGQQWTTPNI
ncbi:hypothetical protein PGTUg99_024843 [Puccinia graminis f. sp. tritici]|uniref:Uncharacterized protein n=2 Tax=Puccinia graminis f. sp. tritici TaxID=56615 RepID=E3LB10_PUCGT|nr:uncharacterized protein PGTG_19719 [Puccinia graminis f. sp. tritici CRL 75-36-700-3]EFP93735.2 hypothetical protein PGTG_19719 [Puccinia graminis f. sp. tritici CRL 75-36-700-3]KAA1102306.1 hypothetical protein PGTUg99_024843 [Puccinia graminis f. sp. tritici]